MQVSGRQGLDCEGKKKTRYFKGKYDFIDLETKEANGDKESMSADFWAPKQSMFETKNSIFIK